MALEAATPRPEPAQQRAKLVTHADHALGKHIAARLLCSGERVRAHVSVQHPARTRRSIRGLGKAGAEVVNSDLYAPDEPANNLWDGIGSVLHASASGASFGKEAVVSVSELGTEKLIRAAETANVQGFVLLHPPTPEIHKLLKHSTLSYTLFCPEQLEVALSGGAHGRLLERRRMVVFMPLLRVADALVFAAAGGFECTTLDLPTVTRRYSHVVSEVEQLLSRPQTPVADVLLAELVMGSPYKLVTPGVARALGLTFPKKYLEKLFSPPEV